MKKVFSIASISVMEYLRNKTVYIIFFISFLFILIGRGLNPNIIIQDGSLQLPFDPQIVAMQVVFHVIVVLSLGLSSLLSLSAFPREFDQGTITLTITRPLGRATFALGKAIGILAISSLNLCLLGIIFFLLFYLKLDVLNFSILIALAFMLLSLILMTLMGMAMTFFIPRILVPLLNILIFIICLFCEIPYYFKDMWTPSQTTAFLNTILPDFAKLQFTCASLIGGTVSVTSCLYPAFTMILYIAGCWYLLVFLFKKRDL